MINDERLLINDGVHTGNTEENGGPQADGVVGQQLPEMDSNRKKIVHGGHGGTRMEVRRRTGNRRIMNTDYSD